jgi:uncharacterized membrane protein HdeD (DUF308 family)
MEKPHLNYRWWTIALRGVAALVLGVIALFAPGLTFMSLVLVFGGYAIVDGVLAVSMSTRGETRNATMARGLVSIVAGAVALLWPRMTGFALLMVIAAWAVASGVLEIVGTIRFRKVLRHEWLLALEGVLSIIFFGIALFVSPLAGAIVLGLWVGAYALVLGGMLIATSFRMRSLQREHPELAAA